MALFTIAFGVLLVVPTAYWVRLKLPGLRPAPQPRRDFAPRPARSSRPGF